MKNNSFCKGLSDLAFSSFEDEEKDL